MTTQESTDKVAALANVPLLALGFRPFYLLAGIFAVMAVPLWMLSFTSGAPVGEYLSGMAWHGHEMIFGFAAAVMAGFLLTAVRNWTGQPTPTGAPLAGLVALWLLARVLMLTGPADAAAVVDILFLPMLGLAIARPIWQSRNTRNYKVLIVLLVLTLTNACYHLAAVNLLPFSLTQVSISAALDVLAILIAIMGGRVIPAFVGNAVQDAEPQRRTIIEIVAIGSLIVILTAGILDQWILLSETAWSALFVVAAIAHGVRLMLWQPFRTADNPLLWMLPVAYAWLPISLGMRALAHLGAVPSGAAVHALTVGAIASLMVAMMMRSALGHSGRRLVAGSAEVSAFVFLQLAAIVRVLVSWVAPLFYRETMLISGFFWTLAFCIFLFRYWSILTRPRIDGRPG